MTKEMNMMIMRFIERTMEEHMCMVIANRHDHKMNTGYKNSIDILIQKVLDRI